MSQSTPTKHDGRAVLFAVAELLVKRIKWDKQMMMLMMSC